MVLIPMNNCRKLTMFQLFKWYGYTHCLKTEMLSSLG